MSWSPTVLSGCVPCHTSPVTCPWRNRRVKLVADLRLLPPFWLLWASLHFSCRLTLCTHNTSPLRVPMTQPCQTVTLCLPSAWCHGHNLRHPQPTAGVSGHGMVGRLWCAISLSPGSSAPLIGVGFLLPGLRGATCFPLPPLSRGGEHCCPLSEGAAQEATAVIPVCRENVGA